MNSQGYPPQQWAGVSGDHRLPVIRRWINLWLNPMKRLPSQSKLTFHNTTIKSHLFKKTPRLYTHIWNTLFSTYFDFFFSQEIYSLLIHLSPWGQSTWLNAVSFFYPTNTLLSWQSCHIEWQKFYPVDFPIITNTISANPQGWMALNPAHGQYDNIGCSKSLSVSFPQRRLYTMLYTGVGRPEFSSDKLGKHVHTISTIKEAHSPFL